MLADRLAPGPATTANPTLYTEDSASHDPETKYSCEEET